MKKSKQLSMLDTVRTFWYFLTRQINVHAMAVFFLIVICVPIPAYCSGEIIEMRIYNSPEIYPYFQEDSGYIYLPFYMARLGHYVEIEYQGRLVPLHRLNELPYYKNLRPNYHKPKLNITLVTKDTKEQIILPENMSESIVKLILYGIDENICDCYCFTGILQGNDAYSGFLPNNTQDLNEKAETPVFKAGDYVQSRIFYEGYSVYSHIATNIGKGLFLSKTGVLGYYIISDLALIKTQWGSHIIHSWADSPQECNSLH